MFRLCHCVPFDRKRANTDDTSTMDDDSDDDDSCSDDSDVEDLDSTAIKFILVNPKSLQECKIAYNDAYDIKQYSNGVKREPFEVEQEVVRYFLPQLTIFWEKATHVTIISVSGGQVRASSHQERA